MTLEMKTSGGYDEEIEFHELILNEYSLNSDLELEFLPL